MPHFILGVDLGAASVKATVLEAGFRQLRLVGFHEEPIEPGDAPPAQRTAEALARLVREHDLADGTLYAALRGDLLSLRLLTMPFSDARKIEQVVGFELESQILHGLEDVVYDHAVADPQAPGGARVLAAAARKEDVQLLLSQCAESGMEARALFCAPLVYGALLDRFWSNDPGPSAIVDLGAEHTNVCVFRGDRVQLARTISQGGAHLTRALARALEITEADAERKKLTEGFAPRGQARTGDARGRLGEILRGALAPLERELRQTLALARAELGAPVTSLILCGGGSRLRGLAERLADEIEVPVRPLALDDPEIFGAQPFAESETAVMPLALAVGLAGATGRREVDFRRGELAYKADFSFLRAKATYLAACLLAVLATGALNAWAALHQLHQDQAVLDQRLRTESAELFGEAQSDPEQVSKRIRQGIKMDELPVPAATAYDLLDEISRNVPAGEKARLDITELEIKPKKTFLKGTTDSAGAVDDIATGLARIACFSNDKGDAVQKGPITNVVGQQDLKQFTLTIASRCP